MRNDIAQRQNNTSVLDECKNAIFRASREIVGYDSPKEYRFIYISPNLLTLIILEAVALAVERRAAYPSDFLGWSSRQVEEHLPVYVNAMWQYAVRLLRLIPGMSWLLVLASALIQIVLFPVAGPVPTLRSALAWIAFVPLLWALARPDASGRPLSSLQAAGLGYCCGTTWYLGSCYWIFPTMYLYGGMPKPTAFCILLLFSLYLGLYHMLFAVAFAMLKRGNAGASGALLLAPFLWVAVELARARITGFPWNLLGYSQIDNAWLIRVAPVAGVMSLSFVVVAVNAAIAFILVGKAKNGAWITGAAVVTAGILQTGTVGTDRFCCASADRNAVLLQENLAVGEAARDVDPISPSDEMTIFSAMSRKPRRYGPAAAPATIVIWPEAPSHFFSVDHAFRVGVGALSRSLNAPAIVGTLGLEVSSSIPQRYLEYDSAAMFNSEGNYAGRYDKVHLVPWGEYIPFKAFFGFAHKLTEGAGDMQPGSERSVFAANGHIYGTFICYESVFGDEVRKFVLNGADVLVNISNDGWYGDTGAPWQHLNMTRMRAIENHRWLLLDTNNGITTAIDPDGRMSAQAPRHVRGAYEFPFAFIEGTTFYTRHGDWFAWLCAGITFIAAAVCVSRARDSSDQPEQRGD